MLCVLIAVGVSLLPDQPSEWSELGIHTHIHNHPCIYTHINIYIPISIYIEIHEFTLFSFKLL